MQMAAHTGIGILNSVERARNLLESTPGAKTEEKEKFRCTMCVDKEEKGRKNKRHWENFDPRWWRKCLPNHIRGAHEKKESTCVVKTTNRLNGQQWQKRQKKLGDKKIHTRILTCWADNEDKNKHRKWMDDASNYAHTGKKCRPNGPRKHKMKETQREHVGGRRGSIKIYKNLNCKQRQVEGEALHSVKWCS